MLFSSISFLYYFLPAVLLCYFILPFRLKNIVLLLFSLIFYFYGEPVYTLLMLGSTLSAYIHGILIDKYRGTGLSKVFLWSSVGISLLTLGFFKYADFFVENVNALTGSDLPLLKLALPIGISFYTFQTLSYTIDVYRGDAAPQKSYVRLATYVALFPQLIAGPIVRYTTVEAELSERQHSFEDFAEGIRRFAVGLGKKVLLADVLGAMAKALYESPAPSVAGYWLYAVAISLQLYFDFSGYSDMAIGLGRIFGFHFLENFNYPFISKSVAEFWRRWHISLGSWFRDYVYIPMGGNRVNTAKWFRNILIVWFLTGFWHGADWNFIIWGLYFAAFLLLEKFWYNRIALHLPKLVSHLYVAVVIAVSFVIFSADGVGGMVTDLKGMFFLDGLPLWTDATGYYLRSYCAPLIFGLLGATPLVKMAVERLREMGKGGFVIDLLEPVFLVVILLVATAYFVDGSFSPFLYFRF